MNSSDLLDRLYSSRERLLVALEPLPDELLLEPRTLGEWSIADLLAHLAAWESELVTGLMRLDQGKKPEHLLQALASRDAYNQQSLAENQGRALDPIFADFQGVRVQLEGWVEEFSNRDLTNPGRYKWLGGKPLWQIIAANSFEHEEAHLPAVEAFSERWLAEQDEPDNNFIKLGDIQELPIYNPNGNNK